MPFKITRHNYCCVVWITYPVGRSDENRLRKRMEIHFASSHCSRVDGRTCRREMLSRAVTYLCRVSVSHYKVYICILNGSRTQCQNIVTSLRFKVPISEHVISHPWFPPSLINTRHLWKLSRCLLIAEDLRRYAHLRAIKPKEVIQNIEVPIT